VSVQSEKCMYSQRIIYTVREVSIQSEKYLYSQRSDSTVR